MIVRFCKKQIQQWQILKPRVRCWFIEKKTTQETSAFLCSTRVACWLHQNNHSDTQIGTWSRFYCDLALSMAAVADLGGADKILYEHKKLCPEGVLCAPSPKSETDLSEVRSSVSQRFACDSTCTLSSAISVIVVLVDVTMIKRFIGWKCYDMQKSTCSITTFTLLWWINLFIGVN